MNNNQQPTEMDVNRELLRKIAAGKMSAKKDNPDPDAVDYDWRVPHSFSLLQIGCIHEFQNSVTEHLSNKLSDKLSMSFDFRSETLLQYYVGAIQSTDSEWSGFVSTISCGADDIGFVIIPKDIGISWINQQLGGSTEDDISGDRDLTTLEKGVLKDIFGTITESLSLSMRLTGGNTVKCDEDNVFDELQLGETNSADEYLCIPCQLEGQSLPAVRFVISSDKIKGILGISDSERIIPKEESHNYIMDYIKATPVKLIATLGTTTIAASDVISIEKGDVLTMPVKAGEPIPVLLRGKPIFNGYIVSHKNQFALQLRDVHEKEESISDRDVDTSLTQG